MMALAAAGIVLWAPVQGDFAVPIAGPAAGNAALLGAAARTAPETASALSPREMNELLDALEASRPEGLGAAVKASRDALQSA